MTSGSLYETTDAGRHWARVRTPAESITHVRFIDRTVGYAWGPTGRLWLTTDDTRSWHAGGLNAMDALEGSSAGVWAIDGPQPYANVWRSAPATTTWTKLGLTPNRGGSLLPDGTTTYVLGEQGAGPVAPSFDVYAGGHLTGKRTLPCERPRRDVPQSPMAVSTDGSLFLVCDVQSTSGTSSPLAYISTDHGRTWAQVSPPPIPATGVAAVRGARFAWDPRPVG